MNCCDICGDQCEEMYCTLCKFFNDLSTEDLVRYHEKAHDILEQRAYNVLEKLLVLDKYRASRKIIYWSLQKVTKYNVYFIYDYDSSEETCYPVQFLYMPEAELEAFIKSKLQKEAERKQKELDKARDNRRKQYEELKKEFEQ